MQRCVDNLLSMSSGAAVTEWSWLSSGRELFPAMLAAIEAARESVCLETYIYGADYLGERFLEALVRAQERGARVRVLVDALGVRLISVVRMSLPMMLHLMRMLMSFVTRRTS